MLPVHLAIVRRFLHVLAATVWVGGQLTLAGLVPGLRALSPDAPRIVARRFNQLAWPAFAVLVLTGIWDITAVHPTWHDTYGATLMIKIAVVALSGFSAWAHATSRSPAGLAIWGRAHRSFCRGRASSSRIRFAQACWGRSSVRPD